MLMLHVIGEMALTRAEWKKKIHVADPKKIGVKVLLLS